jgi:sugar O-acyltransferase (sialic acid O-acetyltransferase NeuD family)
MNKIYIVGTGGFAREVLFLIDQLGDFNKVEAFLEPDHIWEDKWKDKTVMDKAVLPFSDFYVKKGAVSIGIGDPKLRELTVTQLPSATEYISLKHPSANISRWTKIGKGCVITAGCIVTSQIVINDFCQMNLNTTIGHDCYIGAFFTTAPAVNISGICTIGSRVYFGTGSATKQGITICDDVTIGMGAMVVNNINEKGIYVGIPAKKMDK